MNKIKEISVFVIFGLIFFTVHSITKKNESHPNESIISLPKSTTKYTRIESVQILKKFIFNELFIVKEKAIFEKIKSLSENQSENEIAISDFNINISAPIELLNIDYKNKSYSIIRIKSRRKGIDGKIRIPFFETSGEKFFLLKGDAKQLKSIKKEFNKSRSFKHSFQSKSDVSMLTFNHEKLVQSTSISIQKKQVKIKLQNLQKPTSQIQLLREKGFHFSFPLTDGIQIDEQLKQIPILPRINFPFKEIRHISCNYYGFKFTENDSIIGIPKVDLLLKFKNKTQADSLIQDLMNQLKVEFSRTNKRIYMGKESLYFTQINPTTIYLSTLNSNPRLVWSNNSLKITGDLTQLTKLENAGWKGMLIEVFPLFKSTKNLLHKTKKVNYRKTGESTFEITIPIKEKQNVYHELLKFLMLVNS